MKYLYTMVACIFMMLATACQHSSNDDPDKKLATSDHTLLIYMAGDNSLSSICNKNIRLMEQGLLNAADDINLIIYKDNKDADDSLPVLFQLKRTYDKKTNAAKIDTIYLHRYDRELNSCAPEVMTEVVNRTFDLFDTKIKGIEIWSHGMSWIPSDNYKPSTRFIGQDGRNFMELWDMRRALEQCPHMDYMLFDACYVGMAEVAYEFDEVCDYVYGAITEIMDFGFPYNTLLPILATCQEKSKVRDTMRDCVADHSASEIYARNGYTITMLDTSLAAGLAKAVAKLRAASAEKLDELKANWHKYEPAMQHYGRKVVDTRYCFYDLADYVDYMTTGNSSADIEAIKSEIKKNDIIAAYACSTKFDNNPGSWSSEAIDLKGCKGLGVSIPEFFQCTNKEKELTAAYGMTKWGKALGF